MKAIHQAECGDELESFDSVEDLFKSWEDSSTKDEKLDSSDRRRSLNRKTKEHILSRLLNESQVRSLDTQMPHIAKISFTVKMACPIESLLN